MVYHAVRANSQLVQSSFFPPLPRLRSLAFGGVIKLGERSLGCNHLFSFITGKIGKVREIIRTLEWSQSSARACQIPPTCNSSGPHAPSPFPPPPSTFVSLSGHPLSTFLLQSHLQRWQKGGSKMDIIHECAEYSSGTKTEKRTPLVTLK